MANINKNSLLISFFISVAIYLTDHDGVFGPNHSGFYPDFNMNTPLAAVVSLVLVVGWF